MKIVKDEALVIIEVMKPIRPMDTILDIWASSMSCPICSHAGLSVTRAPGIPDLMHCVMCGAEFHFEQGGNRIQLVQYPLVFGPELYSKWMTYQEVRAIVRKVAGSLPLSKSLTIPVTGRSVEETSSSVPKGGNRIQEELFDPPGRTIELARRLQSLGNSPQAIRKILTQDPQLTPAQVDSALKTIAEPERTRRVESILWVVLILMVVVLGGYILFSSGVLGQGVRFVQAAITGDSLQVIPPTPTVYKYAAVGNRSVCPTDRESAAVLFGGRSDRWSYDKVNWMYLDVRTARLYIPEGMAGTYSVLDNTVRIITVEGPAIIDNILAISMDCYR